MDRSGCAAGEDGRLRTKRPARPSRKKKGCRHHLPRVCLRKGHRERSFRFSRTLPAAHFGFYWTNGRDVYSRGEPDSRGSRCLFRSCCRTCRRNRHRAKSASSCRLRGRIQPDGSDDAAGIGVPCRDERYITKETVYQAREDVPQDGPARVLLGSYGSASSVIVSPSPINYLAVRLKGGERWCYEPPTGHTVLW